MSGLSSLASHLSGLSPERRTLLELLVLEEVMAPRDRQEAPALSPQPDTAPLSFGQERLWLLDKLDPGSPAYNTAAALRLSKTLGFMSDRIPWFNSGLVRNAVDRAV